MLFNLKTDGGNSKVSINLQNQLKMSKISRFICKKAGYIYTRKISGVGDSGLMCLGDSSNLIYATTNEDTTQTKTFLPIFAIEVFKEANSMEDSSSLL